MNSYKLLTAFIDKFDIHKSTNGWYRFNNPWDYEHKDKSMAFNPNYKWVKDYRSGYSKPAVQFLLDYLNVEYKDLYSAIESYNETSYKTYKKVDKKPVKLPYEFISIAFGDGIFGQRARKYLINRGFNIDLLDMMGFGYCQAGEFFGYIIIPYTSEGRLVYYSARTFIDSTPKYKNISSNKFGVGSSDIFFNEDALSIFPTVYILEGAFDALTVGPNACATSGWSLSKRQESKILKSPVKEIICICDKGFKSKIMLEFKNVIKHKIVKIVEPELDHGKDVNEWGWDRVKPITEQANQILYGDIIKSRSIYSR